MPYGEGAGVSSDRARLYIKTPLTKITGGETKHKLNLLPARNHWLVLGVLIIQHLGRFFLILEE